ncbi:hypothetical protein OS493_019630, partial [Desmophyllum pertusum]
MSRAKYMASFTEEHFGESCKDVKVVGEGFGIIDGTFTMNSGVFNSNGDVYHNSSGQMNTDSARYVRTVVGIWQFAQPNFPDEQNFDVKSLGLLREALARAICETLKKA